MFNFACDKLLKYNNNNNNNNKLHYASLMTVCGFLFFFVIIVSTIYISQKYKYQEIKQKEQSKL